MRTIDFSKRLARLVKQGKVHQSVRSTRWADATIGEELAVYVGMNHGELCYPECDVVIPGPGKYLRRICTIVVAGNVPLNMTPDALIVDGVEVEDLDAFAYLEGFWDWVQLTTWIENHCTVETPDGSGGTHPHIVPWTYTGVLLTW